MTSVGGAPTAAPVRIDRPSDGVAVVVFNRPDRLNVLNPSSMPALVEALESLATDKDARAVVLTGTGRGFCTGMDLAALDEMASMEIHAQTKWMRDLMRGSIALARLPQPTVAAVNGPATGGGFGDATGCDLRIASRTARSWCRTSPRSSTTCARSLPCCRSSDPRTVAVREFAAGVSTRRPPAAKLHTVQTECLRAGLEKASGHGNGAEMWRTA